MVFNPLSEKRRGYAYVADPLGRIGQGSWVKKGDHFGRILPERQDRPGFDFTQPLKILDAVGMTGQNRRTDVARVENLLGRSGHLDLGQTDGPTGYFGTRMDQSIKSFQKQNGLKIDGRINPGGETINALGRALGDQLRPATPAAWDIKTQGNARIIGQDPVNKKPAADLRQESINRFVRKMLDLKKSGVDLRTYRHSSGRDNSFAQNMPYEPGKDKFSPENMPYRPGYIYDKGHWRRVTRQDALYQNMAAKGGDGGSRNGSSGGPINPSANPLNKKGGTGAGGDGVIVSSSAKAGGQNGGGPKNPSANPLDNPGGGDGKGGDSPHYKVPAYRNQAVSQQAMDSFMKNVGDAKSNMRNAMAEIYAAEGGAKKDRSGSSAYGGITDAGLETAKKSQPGLDGVKKASDLNEQQLVKAYRGDLADALHRYGGKDALESIKSPKTAAAFADTLFHRGPNGGARTIKDATNETINKLSPAERQRIGVNHLDNKTGTKDTLEAIRRLDGNGHGGLLREMIADHRSLGVSKSDVGTLRRINHFRFR